MSLLKSLPAPQRSFNNESLHNEYVPQAIIAKSTIPPYGYRNNWFPKKDEDFADGGAFPEIHIPQYPLGMGLKKNQSNALVMKTDEKGKIKYDDLIRQGHSSNRVIHSKFADLMPKPIDETDPEFLKPDQDTVNETTEKTKRALEALVLAKMEAALPVRAAEKTAPAEYIRYTPSQQGPAFNSGSKQRLIRMVEAQKDPMSPPRFKINQKIPRGPPSPPPPLMHSPSRKVTAKEQAEWKIPPCISNWKNPRGYTIPIDKRVAADGRGLQTVHINENFAKLTEALSMADRKAREAVDMRIQIEKKIAQKEKEAKEQQLQQAAEQARLYRAGLKSQSTVDDSINERDEVRRERAQLRAKERNIQNKDGKGKYKDKDRDISEQIALGLPNPKFNQGPESEFDQRLFNNTRGIDTGFEGGADDLYNIYDQPWRGDSDIGSHIYRPSKDLSSASGEMINEIGDIGKRRFVPDKGFSGADSSRRLNGPVGFEKQIEEEDPFNLSKFLSDAKKAKKRPGDEISHSNRDTTHRKRDKKD